MTGITFVRREIDRAIDVDRQISIHLNHAVEIAFVPIVTAPRLIGHVLDGETLVRRKRNVRQRPGAAFLDRELKHRHRVFPSESQTASAIPRSAATSGPFPGIFASNWAMIWSKCESGSEPDWRYVGATAS